MIELIEQLNDIKADQSGFSDDLIAETEFAILQAYFEQKGIPSDLAQRCAVDVDWTDDEFSNMIADYQA